MVSRHVIVHIKHGQSETVHLHVKSVIVVSKTVLQINSSLNSFLFRDDFFFQIGTSKYGEAKCNITWE